MISIILGEITLNTVVINFKLSNKIKYFRYQILYLTVCIEIYHH